MAELRFALDRSRLDRIRFGAALVTTEPAVFRIAGPGAVACLQGLLTNDVEQPGDQSLIYGALLTPKGMIVIDAWVLRQPQGLTLVTPASGHAAAVGLLQRQLPPRLAQVTDLTGQARVTWLLGGQGFQVLAKSGIGIPESAGRVTDIGGDLHPLALALAPETAHFVALGVGLAPATDILVQGLLEAGATVGDEVDLHASRILAGWPALGAEIDERTLPQEMRYDEIGGVSYTKGCYTGQETVARLHFRGHTNREIKGLRWSGPASLEGSSVTSGVREVGTVRSTLTLDDRMLGLGVLRREVAVGDRVVAGGRPAVVAALPFGADDVDA